MQLQEDAADLHLIQFAIIVSGSLIASRVLVRIYVGCSFNLFATLMIYI